MEHPFHLHPLLIANGSNESFLASMMAASNGSWSVVLYAATGDGDEAPALNLFCLATLNPELDLFAGTGDTPLCVGDTPFNAGDFLPR